MVHNVERPGDTEPAKNPTKILQKTVRGARTKVAAQVGLDANVPRQTSLSVATMASRRLRILKAAEEFGLLEGPKGNQLGGRFPRGLVEEAKRNSGLTETTELLTYALTKVALEDHYGEKLLARKGRIPKGILVVED